MTEEERDELFKFSELEASIIEDAVYLHVHDLCEGLRKKEAEANGRRLLMTPEYLKQVEDNIILKLRNFSRE
tara:strand:- start:960 stop:1175 length:216 start_codon:yes stop_codon:yes gene_type:complete